MIKNQAKRKGDKKQSAFQDNSGRFAVDHLLRNHGYCIYRRCGKGEPIWLRQGVQYQQREALLRIAKFQVSDALWKDEQYWEEYQ